MPLEYRTEMLQNPDEMARFVAILRSLDVRSYLEIGSKFGGSLWKVGMSALPFNSRVTVIDIPRGNARYREAEKSLRACAVALYQQRRINVKLILGDSTDPANIEAAAKAGPYDAVLLDADHTLPYVEKDFANYRPMCTKVFAMHDIAWHRQPEWTGTRIDVPIFWERIKEGNAHEEIKLDPTRKNNGIGVLFIGQTATAEPV